MRFVFDSRRGLIIVRAEAWGPVGSVVLQLALDTGATSTVINTALLTATGYDPAAVADRVQVTTGSTTESVPRVTLIRFAALGQERTALPVLAHTLPPGAGVDGVLGLDFFRDQRLCADFRAGLVELD